MAKELKNTADGGSDEVSVKEVIIKIKAEVAYLKSKWLLIFALGIVGAIAGFAYARFTKPRYVATSTFVLDDGTKSGGFSQYAGLASLAGIDLGKEGGGIFQGDNILELYKSRVMMEKTLLSPVSIDGKNQLLIDRYIDFNKLRDEWKGDPRLSGISFAGDPSKFNRKQDSVVTDIVETFNRKFLSVVKLDKKLSIIKVELISTDELFAKAFNEKLVETVNNFYAQTKTKKSTQNVAILQRQADSVKSILGYSIGSVASALDAAPNANPNMLSLKVPSQKRQIDVQANSAIYSEIVKNLELSKISLRQETPLIQVIDQPVLPLTIQKTGKIKALVIGFILSAFLTIAWLLAKRIANNLME